jgi:hypothetical protein
VLAEGRALEEPVDDERRGEIGDHQPGRQPRAVPEVERLVAPEEQRPADPRASHLGRSAVGQLRSPGSSRLARRRGSMNGQAMQKRLPTRSSASTTKPRHWIHGPTPATFSGPARGPMNPSRMMIAARRSSGTWTAVRACFQRRNRPRRGARVRSPRGAATAGPGAAACGSGSSSGGCDRRQKRSSCRTSSAICSAVMSLPHRSRNSPRRSIPNTWLVWSMSRGGS